MKPAEDFRQPRRKCAPWRLVLLAVLAAASIENSSAQETPLAESPRLLLQSALATRGDAQPEAKKAAPGLEAAIKAELLMTHGRLLREGFTAERQWELAAALAASTAADAELQQMLQTFPSADDLAFDGQHYVGGNLASIDAILGKSGRPIAFDREIPALLVPLTPEAEAALAEKRTAFQADADALPVRAAAEARFGVGSAALMFADGQFLRTYIGRFDDLYFHLFQNGNGASALAFGGLADGLVDRVYQPVHGICAASLVPAPGFDLDDILSDGAKTAVRRYLATQPGHAEEPFQRLAFRVLPSIVGKARSLPPGARFTATSAEITRALRVRQHLYPSRVPPLYRTADRFLGWTGSLLMRVANNPALPPGAADSWYPLPARDSRGPEEKSSEGASSNQLFESSSTPDIVWEDPQLSNLLADPTSRGKSSASAVPKVETDPRLRAVTARLIAVVTPTAEDAKSYFAAIGASDEKLRAIEKMHGRVRLLREWIASARPAPSGLPPAASEDPSAAKLSRALGVDLDSLERRDSELSTSLQAALQERAELRSDLENKLQRDQVAPLHALGKKPDATGTPNAGQLTL